MNLQNVSDMNKSTTIVLILCLLRTFVVYSQNTPCTQYEGRPMPDWVMGATPEPHNNTYYYKVFEGSNSDREVARNQAVKKAFQQAMTFISVGVKADEVFAAIEQEEYDINVISETFSIPIYFTCEFAKKSPDGTKWIYWLLCQIAVRGNIVPQFNTHFSDCNTHDIWDKEKEDCMKGISDAEKTANVRSLIASSFIPGMGQMLKGQYGTGAAFLASEVALFAGGMTCCLLGKEQIKIMQSMETSYTDYQIAKKKKNTLDIVAGTCFGIGIAVHVANMVHAWYVKDKKLTNNIAFTPTIIQTDEYSTPSYAMGVGIQIKL